MEIINTAKVSSPIKAALFDFDGTLSTLRCGWEEVMYPMMIGHIGRGRSNEQLASEVAAYIDHSTGIQTIHQMKWLAERVVAAGGEYRDPWAYKEEYNTRLMEQVKLKKQAIQTGKAERGSYLIAGAEEFLRELQSRGVKLYVASGTDHPDVRKEAQLLGLYNYFDEIAGAPLHEENCSKQAVLKRLVETHGLSGNQVAVVGDGKVEIALGKAIGAHTLGLATNEADGVSLSRVKRTRLIQAGADAIASNLLNCQELLAWLGL